MVESAQGTTTNSLNDAINDYGVVGGTYINPTGAHLEHTDNPLDLGIEGQGYFSVQTKDGVRYTRNGNFQVDKNGLLLASDGSSPVLGLQGPIHLPSGPVTVSEDGTVSVSGAVTGKLKLVDVDPRAMQAEGNANFTAPVSAVTPASNAHVRQGTLEGSNVEPVSATVGLVALQRHADMLQRTLKLFYNDFDGTAVNQLSKV
jgi:flagellar basal-body rod protein FlgF/flagellar basal-body rod protein FlgG